MAATDNGLATWDKFQWRRTMETFGQKDEPVVATGPGGEVDGIWQVGNKLLGNLMTNCRTNMWKANMAN